MYSGSVLGVHLREYCAGWIREQEGRGAEKAPAVRQAWCIEALERIGQGRGYWRVVVVIFAVVHDPVEDAVTFESEHLGIEEVT